MAPFMVSCLDPSMRVLASSRFRVAVASAAFSLLIAGCGSNSDAALPVETQKSTPSITSPPNSSDSTPGVYITRAEYEGAKSEYENTTVVLFFNASWCSTCKIARDNIQSDLSSIPSGLTIVTVDFDASMDLRRKYGVTLQHTYVQIDALGDALAKWSGSVTAQEIADNTV
jgi:thiol-disulfide isomerase/thioredoxin